MTTKSRLISKLIDGKGIVKPSLLDSDGIGVSTQKSVATISGTATYSSADTLPTSATDGDQALVTSTNRLYIYSGSGWYNIALVNNTPYWSTEASSSYDLNKNGTSTTITILAVDSEGVPIIYTAVTDSDFNQIATVTKDSDNGRVFIVTPTDSENGTAIGGTGTVTFKASDGVNLVSTVSTFSIAFKIVNSKFSVMLLQADTASNDNQVDASTVARSITEGGNITSTAFSPYHPGGYSTYFDGTSNANIQVKGESTLTVGNGDFSVSVWYKSDGALDGRVIASSLATAASGTASQLYWNVSVQSNGSVWLQTRSAANGGQQYYGKSASGLVTANTWHHLVFARISGVHYCAVDGVEDTSVTQNTATMNVTSQELAIGLSNVISYESYGKGYIRDFNFCTGGVEYDLSAGNYTVPTEPISPHANTKFLLSGLPYIVDKSASPLTIDIVGTAIIQQRLGPYDYLDYSKAEHGGSIYFDGLNDNLSMASSADFNFGSSDWTIEAWLYQTVRDASNICRWYMSGTNGDGNAIHVSINTNGTLDCGRAIGGGVITGTSTAVMPLNTWNHVVATKEGSNGYLYLNGKQVSTSGSATEQTSGDISLRIGYDTVNTVNEQFTGYMSDLQVIKGARKYTGNFTPPTSPISAHTNSVLLTCTNKNDIWDASAGKSITKNGNVVASNTKRKFTTSSAMYFDGTGDWLHTAPSSNLLTMGTGDFTIECWVWKADTNHRGIFQIGSNAAGLDVNYAGSIGFGYQVGVWQIYAANTAVSGSSFTLTSDTWYHAAMVRNSGTTKLYIDGSEEISVSDTHNYVGTYMAIGGYYTTGYLHNGYIQDLRVTKGLARYTSNFTPPTAEFDG